MITRPSKGALNHFRVAPCDVRPSQAEVTEMSALLPRGLKTGIRWCNTWCKCHYYAARSLVRWSFSSSSAWSLYTSFAASSSLISLLSCMKTSVKVYWGKLYSVGLSSFSFYVFVIHTFILCEKQIVVIPHPNVMWTDSSSSLQLQPFCCSAAFPPTTNSGSKTTTELSPAAVHDCGVGVHLTAGQETGVQHNSDLLS